MLDNRKLRKLGLELDEYIANAEYRYVLLEEIANCYVECGTKATQLYIKHYMAENHPYFRLSTVDKILLEAEVTRTTHMIDSDMFYDWDGSYIAGGSERIE